MRAFGLLNFFPQYLINHCFPPLILGSEGMFLKGLPYSLKHRQMHWFSVMSRICCWTKPNYDALRAWAMNSLAETGDPKATVTRKGPCIPTSDQRIGVWPDGSKTQQRVRLNGAKITGRGRFGKCRSNHSPPTCSPMKRLDRWKAPTSSGRSGRAPIAWVM